MEKCNHKTTKMGYLQGHIDAEKRSKKGEKQLLCPVCKKYIWEHLWTKR